jgi:hypothetical protein
VLLTLYGAANLVQHGLMEAGIVDTPDGLGSDAVTWHLALWDPWWLLGGILFLLAAREGTAPPEASPSAPLRRVRGRGVLPATSRKLTRPTRARGGGEVDDTTRRKPHADP